MIDLRERKMTALGSKDDSRISHHYAQISKQAFASVSKQLAI